MEILWNRAVVAHLSSEVGKRVKPYNIYGLWRGSKSNDALRYNSGLTDSFTLSILLTATTNADIIKIFENDGIVRFENFKPKSITLSGQVLSLANAGASIDTNHLMICRSGNKFWAYVNAVKTETIVASELEAEELNISIEKYSMIYDFKIFSSAMPQNVVDIIYNNGNYYGYGYNTHLDIEAVDDISTEFGKRSDAAIVKLGSEMILTLNSFYGGIVPPSLNANLSDAIVIFEGEVKGNGGVKFSSATNEPSDYLINDSEELLEYEYRCVAGIFSRKLTNQRFLGWGASGIGKTFSVKDFVFKTLFLVDSFQGENITAGKWLNSVDGRGDITLEASDMCIYDNPLKDIIIAEGGFKPIPQYTGQKLINKEGIYVCKNKNNDRYFTTLDWEQL